jgi:hypothetical protein
MPALVMAAGRSYAMSHRNVCLGTSTKLPFVIGLFVTNLSFNAAICQVSSRDVLNASPFLEVRELGDGASSALFCPSSSLTRTVSPLAVEDQFVR